MRPMQQSSVFPLVAYQCLVSTELSLINMHSTHKCIVNSITIKIPQPEVMYNIKDAAYIHPY